MKVMQLHRMHQRISVPFDYPVIFTRSLFDPRNPCLAKTVCRLAEHRRHRVFVCMDDGVYRRVPDLPRKIGRYFENHAGRLALAGPIEITSRGHHAKQGLTFVNRAIRWMADRKLDRHSFVMIIGGGSILDSVGLAASLVHRGIRVLRVPTTVTAQNDVGVGVKTGVDAFGAKNFLGSFAPPFAVFNDLNLLKTLPARERIAGIAEAFKVAMIKDRGFFAQLCRDAARLRTGKREVTERAIIRCARLHLEHIRDGGDPFESGSARPLDFGHWSAHYLEAASDYQLRHGEAVAIGISLDACIAAERRLIQSKDRNRLHNALLRSGLPIWHPLLHALDRHGNLRLRQGLQQFQEHLGGDLTLTFPGPLGRRVEIHDVSNAEILRGISLLKKKTAGGHPSDPRRHRYAVAQ